MNKYAIFLSAFLLFGCKTDIPKEIEDVRIFLENHYQVEHVRIREYTPIDSIYSPIPVYNDIYDRMKDIHSYTEEDKNKMEELYKQYQRAKEIGSKNAIGTKVTFKLYDKPGDRHVETFIFDEDHNIKGWGLNISMKEMMIQDVYRTYLKEYEKRSVAATKLRQSGSK